MVSPSLTASQVKKAGRTVRRWIRGEDVPPEDVRWAYLVINAYRATHARPLVTANNGLRSMVRTEGCQVEVSQRLKRFPTIVDKLVREPTLPLSSMQDIGGVRAILRSIDEVRRVESRLKKNRSVTGYSDYITHPRLSGYRGVHVVVLYDDRQIEVQLRTRIMHEWAITVERVSFRLNRNFKGDGEHAVQHLMAVISHAMALEEEGKTVDSSVLLEMQEARRLAGPYLEGGR